MELRLMTDEEVAAADKEQQDWWDSLSEEDLAKIEWHEKHPRCETCGQFLKKRVVFEGGLGILGKTEREDQWVSHYVQDYWGEWDHI